MAANSVLENLRKQWAQYNSPPTTRTRSSSQSKPRVHGSTKVEQKPAALKSTFSYECYRCQAPVVFNTLWWDDFRNCYIPLNEDMVPHKCKIEWRNNKFQSKIFHTF